MLHFTQIQIYSNNLSTVVDNIVEHLNSTLIKNQASCCISTTGAHGLVEANKDISFKNILKSFYYNLPDGMPLVWWGRLKGFNTMGRCYGPDLLIKIMVATNKLDIGHFFCGGKPGVAEELKKVVELKYQNKNIKGVYTPPFHPLQEDDWSYLTTKIIESKAKIVWVGLSTPKQEKFAYELSNRVKVKFIITIGAAFDFHTGRLSQAPPWMRNLGLEWFYRLCMEPKRLWKRYLEVVPKFFILVIFDLNSHYIRKVFSRYIQRKHSM